MKKGGQDINEKCFADLIYFREQSIPTMAMLSEARILVSEFENSPTTIHVFTIGD